MSDKRYYVKYEAVLDNLLILAYLVPPERVRRLVPAGLDLELLPTPDGERAMVSSLCFQNRRWFPFLQHPGWRLLPRLQATFRVYVRYRRHPGVYFLRTYVSSFSVAALGLAAPAVRWAQFDAELTSDKVSYRAEAGGRLLRLSARPTPVTADPELTQRVTQILFGLMRLRGPFHVELEVAHDPFSPCVPELGEVRLDEWEALGVLSREELQRPWARLFQRRANFQFFPPRWAGRMPL